MNAGELFPKLRGDCADSLFMAWKLEASPANPDASCLEVWRRWLEHASGHDRYELLHPMENWNAL